MVHGLTLHQLNELAKAKLIACFLRSKQDILEVPQSLSHIEILPPNYELQLSLARYSENRNTKYWICGPAKLTKAIT